MLYTKSIKYPVTFNLTSGKTDLEGLTTSINRCIALILTSAKGELLGDPDYGSRLYELLFNQYSNDLEDTIKKEIVESISKYETRVKVQESDISIEHIENADRNAFKITIKYTVKETNNNYEIVIPLEDGAIR